MSNKDTLIPIADVKDFAVNHDQDILIILGFSPQTAVSTVTTWGKELEQSEYAANFGNRLKESVGFKPEDCKSVSAPVQALFDASVEAQKMITKLQWFVEENNISYSNIHKELAKILSCLRGAKKS